MAPSLMRVLLVASAAAVLSPAVSAAPRAADRSIWQGRYDEGERANFSHVAGDDWFELQRSAGEYVKIPYREVTRTFDFVELEMSGRPSYRVRVYADRIESKSPRQADRWFQIATGRWTE